MSVEAEKQNIDIFIETLRHRLHKKADEGFTGWDYGRNGHGDDNGRLPSTASNEDLKARMERSLREEKYIDVTAFASMLWRRQVSDAEELEKLKAKI